MKLLASEHANTAVMETVPEVVQLMLIVRMQVYALYVLMDHVLHHTSQDLINLHAEIWK
jgi:hypothetical protein